MTKIFNPIKSLCKELESQFDQIPLERKMELGLLSQYLEEKYLKEQTPRLIMICTHNSRRSHLGQIWLAVAADYYGLPKLETFSGGTEATAFNPRAVRAMKALGFEIESEDKIENKQYAIRWQDDMEPYVAFSKKYDDSPNPTEAFGAIMVCNSADEACPVVFGSDFRLSLPYHDPKAFDDTDQEVEKYDERARQIGREMLFVLQQINTEE